MLWEIDRYMLRNADAIIVCLGSCTTPLSPPTAIAACVHPPPRPIPIARPLFFFQEEIEKEKQMGLMESATSESFHLPSLWAPQRVFNFLDVLTPSQMPLPAKNLSVASFVALNGKNRKRESAEGAECTLRNSYSVDYPLNLFYCPNDKKMTKRKWQRWLNSFFKFSF